MGMAASQARYLALVARKSNCEYEGQQINQARTALSNQSANLFNQMLGLSVPIPPSTQDFTKTQYSYTDGLNGSTIDSWQQLATPEEDYNYVVTHHYYTDVYTGSQKKLSDPQVQFSKGLVALPEDMAATLSTLTSTRIERDKVIDEYEKIIKNHEAAVKANDDAIAAYDAAVLMQQEAQAAADAAQAEYDAAVQASNDYKTSTYDPLQEAMNNAKSAYDEAVDELKNIDSYKGEDKSYTKVAGSYPAMDGTMYVFGAGEEYTPFNELPDDFSGNNGTTKQTILDSIEKLKSVGALPADYDINNVYVWNSNRGNGDAIAFKEDLDRAYIAEEPKVPVYYAGTQTGSVSNKVDNAKNDIKPLETAYNNSVTEFNIAEAEYGGLKEVEYEKDVANQAAQSALELANTTLATAERNKNTAADTLAAAEAEKARADAELKPTIDKYDETLAIFNSYSSPEYIGNCELTLLETLSKDQLAEIKQVTADMAEQEINSSINRCFDEDGNYTGGIYSFKMNGVTYFTTYEDLQGSYSSGTGNNQIDGQTKMNYYNASYVSTKIEKTEKALLETDGYGRFSSIRFEDDSVTYALKMETITDDVAYEDAMNQYYYENAKYDKMIQDINARTSIIQHQDQQLELRLKQLDTEQKALSTEMEAVKKIVDSNVESSFKTFNG